MNGILTSYGVDVGEVEGERLVVRTDVENGTSAASAFDAMKFGENGSGFLLFRGRDDAGVIQAGVEQGRIV